MRAVGAEQLFLGVMLASVVPAVVVMVEQTALVVSHQRREP
jgi:hypothetical protein